MTSKVQVSNKSWKKVDSDDQPAFFNISSTEAEALLAADTGATNNISMPENLRISLTHLPSNSLRVTCEA